jgi:uroporphyrin-III C-methyltransferase/precorrin-2 dehydrogenase/sirohydrochlorin ferrochelatase/uroporphyrin-III C-methyltransferase
VTINELMVQFASAGKMVVRLKGGDLSIFSNILDELLTLAKHKIPFEIIPGVTAALGAAAYAGIPLTARGYSTAVRFLTFYKSDIITEEYWKELANTSDTLVFYMSAETLENAVHLLTTHGISEEKQMAIVEQATTPFQHVTITNPYHYQQHFKGRSYISPTLVIIGKVVALHEQFRWLENSSSREHYFHPIKNGNITKGAQVNS